MICIIKRIKINGSVLEIQEAADALLVLDNLYNLYLLTLREYQFTKSVNLTKGQEPWHRYGRGLAASPQSRICLGLTKSAKAVVLELSDTIKKRATLGWHKADISCAAFSEDGNLLATGGEDGKAILYALPSCELAYSFFPRPDYIALVVFSRDSRWLAVSSYDKSTIIFDLERNIEMAQMETEEVVEGSCFSPHQSLLFFICRDGATGVYDFEQKKMLSCTNTTETWLTACCLLPDGKHVVVGGKREFLYLFRLEDNAKIATIKLQHVGLSHLAVVGRTQLLLGYVEGVIEVVDMAKYADEMEVHLKVNDYHHAREVTQKNLFLKVSKAYTEALEEGWKRVSKIAIDLLAKRKIQDAMGLVEPFLDDPVRNEEFSTYMAQQEHVANFLECIERNEVAEAYKMAENDATLCQMQVYAQMEERWQKIFETSKKLLAANAQLNLPKATALLKPYANIKSKKELVITLLRNTDKYLEADTAIKERRFADYFRLAERFPFLKDTEVYTRTLTLGEQLIDKMAILENDKQFEKATQMGKILVDLVPFRQAAVERLKLIEQKVAFLESAQKKEYQKAYLIVEKSPELKVMSEFLALNDMFVELSKKAYEHAFAGYPNTALSTLGEFIGIRYWEEKIASVMNVAYLNEIKRNAGRKAGELNWVKTLEYYISLFGKNGELEKICEMASLKEILDGITSKGDPQGYKRTTFGSTIIVE